MVVRITLLQEEEKNEKLLFGLAGRLEFVSDSFDSFSHVVEEIEDDTLGGASTI
jgi:hypothetical protein